MKEIDKFSAAAGGGRRTEWPPGSLYKRGSVRCVQTGCQDFCTHCVQNGCQNVVRTVQNGRQKVCTKKYRLYESAPPPKEHTQDAAPEVDQGRILNYSTLQKQRLAYVHELPEVLQGDTCVCTQMERTAFQSQRELTRTSAAQLGLWRALRMLRPRLSRYATASVLYLEGRGLSIWIPSVLLPLPLPLLRPRCSVLRALCSVLLPLAKYQCIAQRHTN